ncbi:MAG TPA: TIGR00282 family metallophosphoesterase [Candidatus Acidoferrales bacterium]|nr:TIGR00282 family metallophosphoesterase [Candidatus Acidoferrales bacterium]
MAMSPTPFRLLFVGDVVGRPGREAVRDLLPDLRTELSVNFVVLNGENSAAGFGITAKIAHEFLGWGADVITLGNHVWDQKQFVQEIVSEERVLRPDNFPPGTPGRGAGCFAVGADSVLVMNLMGRLFMPALDDPFRAADRILSEPSAASFSVCDVHAEATSEKQAMGWYLDGRVSVVVGTHTHVPTADARVLPGGTAYVTDVGMVGPRDSVIGVDSKAAVDRFLTAMPTRFNTATGVVTFNSVLVTIDRLTGRAQTIQRIDREHMK